MVKKGILVTEWVSNIRWCSYKCTFGAGTVSFTALTLCARTLCWDCIRFTSILDLTDVFSEIRQTAGKLPRILRLRRKEKPRLTHACYYISTLSYKYIFMEISHFIFLLLYRFFYATFTDYLNIIYIYQHNIKYFHKNVVL